MAQKTRTPRQPRILLFALLILAGAAIAGADGWYDASWQYRHEIVIDQSIADSDLTEFSPLADNDHIVNRRVALP